MAQSITHNTHVPNPASLYMTGQCVCGRELKVVLQFLIGRWRWHGNRQAHNLSGAVCRRSCLTSETGQTTRASGYGELIEKQQRLVTKVLSLSPFCHLMIALLPLDE